MGEYLPGSPRVFCTKMASMRKHALWLTLFLLPLGCRDGKKTPQHRERAASRDGGCIDPNKPSAFFYPAENRTDYKPDDPFKDRCSMLVPDHLFCCPPLPRATDR